VELVHLPLLINMLFLVSSRKMPSRLSSSIIPRRSFI
jgi:hypothetical protein